MSTFNHASRQLVPIVDTEKLFSNFIGEEMQALSAVTNDGNLHEEFLQISALKVLDKDEVFLIRI